MARKDKSLTTAFNQVTETEKAVQPIKPKLETEKEDVTLNTQSITSNVTSKKAIEDVLRDGVGEVGQTLARTFEQSKNEFLSQYEEKKKKKTVEETHTRTTFLFDNELLKRLDKLAKGKRGFKTMAINKAIKDFLDELEK